MGMLDDLTAADEALKALGAHYSHSSDGMDIICLCIRGQNHTEDEFDIPVGDDE